LSVNGLDGTVSGTETYTAGKLGKSFEFDGSTHVNIGNDAALALSDDFTVCAWVFVTGTDQYQGIVTRLQQDPYDGYGIVVNDGKFSFAIFNDGSTEYIYADSAFSLSTWYHVAAVVRDGTAYLYVNGTKQTDTYAGTPGTLQKDAVIGAFYSDGTNELTGYIDEACIFSSALSDSQISDLYNSGVGQAVLKYPTSSPHVDCNASIDQEEVNSITESSTKPSGTEIKYTVKFEGQWYYHDGANWVVGDGTYSNANTETEFNANISDFSSNEGKLYGRIFLHSDGDDTPELDTVTVDFDFFSEPPGEEETCVVYGYLKDEAGNVLTSSITVTLSDEMRNYKTETQIKKTGVTVTPDASGYWEVELLTNSGDSGGDKYVFNFGNTKVTKTITTSQTVAFNDLD